MDKHKWESSVTNSCTVDYNKIGEYVWISPLNIILRTSENEFKVEIGISKISDDKKICDVKQKLIDEGLPLYGFDDFNMYIK